MKKFTKNQRIGVVLTITVLLVHQMIAFALYYDTYDRFEFTYQEAYWYSWLILVGFALFGTAVYYAVEWIEQAGGD